MAKEKKDNPESIVRNGIESLAIKYGLSDVFDDVLDYSMLMLKWWDLKEENFQHLADKYPEQKDRETFAKVYFAFAEIADNSGQGFKDPFGWYFEEFITHGHNGQFFTPEHICDFMALLNGIDQCTDGQSVNDPACGSGRTLLAAGKINRNLRFYGADLDRRCAKMTLINFMFNSMRGQVACMNTLSNEYYCGWQVDLIPTGNGIWIPMYYEIPASKCIMVLPLPTEKPKEPLPEFKKIESKSSQQITLF